MLLKNALATVKYYEQWLQVLFKAFSCELPQMDLERMPPSYRELVEECVAPIAEQRPTFSEILPKLRRLLPSAQQSTAKT